MTINDIVKSQKGDRDSTLKLINKFTPLLKKYAFKLNYEDAYNDLILNFIECIHNFHVENIKSKAERSIVSYICTSIHSSYVKRLNEIIRLQNLFIYSNLSESEQYYIESLSATNDSHFKLYMESLQDFLTAPEISIIELVYYYGFSVNDIANFYGISRQAVNQMKNRALRKLKKDYMA
ncbi:RNA polymerase sigma factor (sigma-70 family) [Lachnotalea glycerini]|uniref:RNA polymerase sigma factor (Sigma-70 family) n=1 Tax=Lachnotalea glycerini TaxID=1763509 RepID=A0A255IJ32_9FIRM|nr:sigma-70 family RNA polymerase sigma factor [Lachnotalea glycerini]PXV86254.1 RNA polymerase sigma factor (sigma-70 family) [Lachnotalea glycerini]RDY31573.1 sigma-70 family RNA polymerase sigma factor [Lachnotalea glycerini]